MTYRRGAWVFALLLLAAPTQAATLELPAPDAELEVQKERPGRIHVGPFYLTPWFRISTIGLDTNVFYTATDRRTDLSASAGPGLTVVLPIRGGLRMSVDSGLTYVYFVRTASERRLGGDTHVRIGWLRPEARLQLGVGGGLTNSFVRPEMEVDRRLEETEKSLSLQARYRLFGRTSVAAATGFRRLEYEQGQEFLGTDLRDTLERDVYSAKAGLGYALTAKTELTLEATHEDHRFRLDSSRDGKMQRAVFGIRTESKAYLAGEAVVGLVWYKPDDVGLAEKRTTYASVDVTWHVSPRTRIGGGYSRDLAYTAFIPIVGAPIRHTETFSARVEKDLGSKVSLTLSGWRRKTSTLQPVRLVLASGERIEVPRDDESHEGAALLKYRVHPRFSIGATSSYTKRRSTVADLGVEGLLLGATVIFTP